MTENRHRKAKIPLPKGTEEQWRQFPPTNDTPQGTNISDDDDDDDIWLMMMVDAESSGGSLAGVRIQGRDTFRNGRSGWSSRLDL